VVVIINSAALLTLLVFIRKMIDLEVSYSQINTPLVSQNEHSKDHDDLFTEEPNKIDNYIHNHTIRTHTGGIYMHSIIATTSFGSRRSRAWPIAMTLLSPAITMLLVIAMITMSLHKITTKLNCDTLLFLPSFTSSYVSFLGLAWMLSILCIICIIIHKDVKDAMLEQALLQKAKQDKHIIYPRAAQVVQFGLRARQIILPTFFSITAVLLFLSWNDGGGVNLMLVGCMAYSNSLLGRLFFRISSQQSSHCHLHEALSIMYEKEEEDIQKASQLRSKIMVGVPTTFVRAKVVMALLSLSTKTVCDRSHEVSSLLNILNTLPHMIFSMDNMLVAAYSNWELRVTQIISDIVLLTMFEICSIMAVNR